MNPSKEEIVAVLKKAQADFANQQYATAFKKYQWVERHIQDDTDNLPFLWIEMGWTLYLMQDFSKAIQYLENALQSSNLNQKQVFDCLRLIGFSQEYTGNPDKATAYLQDALLQAVPESDKRHTYFELGKIFFLQNLTKEAKPYLETAQKLLMEEERDYVQTTRYYLGFIAFFENDTERAEDYFQAYIVEAKDPKAQVPGLFGMAHLYFDRKNFAGLVDICQKIIELDPDFYDKETLAFFLSTGYKELENWEQLAMFLPQLINTYPKGRYKSAYPELQKALAKHRPSS